ncbi:MAG: hypothetical protein EXR75_02900 [Myxococcales bacterium]|nr:hypothetical protein [Myxococcales bacterium]
MNRPVSRVPSTIQSPVNVRHERFVRLVFVAALGAQTSACGGNEEPGPTLGPVPDPLSYDVAADGPFAAGYRTLTTSYESPGGLGARTLTLNIWYPSEEAGGPTPVYSKLFGDDDVYVDAPLARPAFESGAPVLVHSHGFRGYGGNSSELMRHFATHGWVAIAPDHRDNTLLDAVDPLPLYHHFQRPLDIRAALDALATLAPNDPLAGAVDLEHVAMSGHSFGTFTAWASAGATFARASIEAACETGELARAGCTDALIDVFTTELAEPRLRAAIPMAGGARDHFFGADGYDTAKIPILLMTGTDDDVGAASLFDKVSADVELTWVDIEGGCHQLFGFGGCKNIDDAVGFPIVNATALAFARFHVLGDDDAHVAAIVGGTETVSELLHYKSK